MGDIPSDDEYADLETNTADLDAYTADVMLMSNQDYVQEQNHFSYPQPATSNLMIQYDSSPQQTSTQLVPYDNSDAVYYSNSNEDDDEDFKILNRGHALIARAFNKFSNKTNNRLRSSSNTRNQAGVQGERIDRQGRNAERTVGNIADVGNAGNKVKVLDKQNDNGRLRNDIDADCAKIRPSCDSEPNFDKGQMDEEDVIPIYDTEPNFAKEHMVEVQSTVDHIMHAN
jgi:hypothetical protein